MRIKLGFSLIELLVAMALMLILASIAYPLYTQHATRAKSKNAKAALIQLASRLELYHQTHDSYQGASCGELNLKCETKDKSYRLRIQRAATDSFEIQAVPMQRKHRAISLNSQGIFKQANYP